MATARSCAPSGWDGREALYTTASVVLDTPCELEEVRLGIFKGPGRRGGIQELLFGDYRLESQNENKIGVRMLSAPLVRVLRSIEDEFVTYASSP